MVPAPQLTVDVIADVVCPWCYVGKRHLSKAIAAAADLDLVVRWRPFQLDRELPQAGVDYRPYLEAKFGGADKVDVLHARLAEVGAELDIPFAFERITRIANTFNAHRLIRWAHVRGVQEEVVERLYTAFFVEGADFSTLVPLMEIAEAVDMDPEHVAERIADDYDREAIEREIEAAQNIGVTQVPCVILDNRLAVLGAQQPDVFVEAFRQALAEREEDAAPPSAGNDNESGRQ